MSDKIKAIETNYKGYRMRSRLEARWATFFDALGVPWRYEVEGYEKRFEGEKVIRYLPDFYLPESKTWVEVKGSDEQLRDRAVDMESFLDFDCPLPGFTHSGCSPYRHGVQRGDGDNACGLLILGDIPEPTFGIALHPMIQHCKGLIWTRAYFVTHSPYVIVTDPEDRWLEFCCTDEQMNALENE